MASNNNLLGSGKVFVEREDKKVNKEFPRFLYHKEKDSIIVKDKEEMEAMKKLGFDLHEKIFPKGK